MSRADLDSAIRLRKPPDLFELRLDQLAGDLDAVENRVSKLRRPLIITARHPQEGGANKLSTRHRRDLLLRFLHRARYVDVELRSASALRSILKLAGTRNVRRIISYHNLKSTPRSWTLQTKARAAKSWGADIFKVATRTDTPAQLARLLDFITNRDVDLRRLFTRPLAKTTLKAKCRSNNFAASELVEIGLRLFREWTDCLLFPRHAYFTIGEAHG